MRSTLHSIATRWALFGSVCVFALPVRAQQTEESTTTVHAEREWYGPSVFLLYGIGYSAFAVGLYGRTRESQPLRLTGAVVLSAGVGTAVFGVPLAHWTHDEFGAGFISLGGQVGSIVGGGALGYAISDGETTGLLVGAAAGHAVFAVADGLFLAQHERVLSVETTSVRFELVPNGLGAAVRMTH